MNTLNQPLMPLFPALLIALLAISCLTGSANAAGPGSIVFVKKNDVWISDADGGEQHRLTWDGTAPALKK